MSKPIGIAVLGLGNVGREVVRIIESSAAALTARIGAPLELRGVAVQRAVENCARALRGETPWHLIQPEERMF